MEGCKNPSIIKNMSRELIKANMLELSKAICNMDDNEKIEVAKAIETKILFSVLMERAIENENQLEVIDKIRSAKK